MDRTCSTCYWETIWGPLLKDPKDGIKLYCGNKDSAFYGKPCSEIIICGKWKQGGISNAKSKSE